MDKYCRIYSLYQATYLRCLKLYAISFLITPQLFAQPFNNPANIEPGHVTGHVGVEKPTIWPPQPQGIRNSRVLNDPRELAREQEKQRQNRELDQKIRIKDSVKKVLGKRFVYVTALNDRIKQQSSTKKKHLIYFSSDNNVTVDVTVEGDDVTNVATIPSSQYQPEITDEERLSAEKIARNYFVAQGDVRVRQLQGFGILSYTALGKGFHNTRVIYISFHVNSDAPPELMAWVDLSSQKVIRSRKEG